jgi:hypothetical protein
MASPSVLSPTSPIIQLGASINLASSPSTPPRPVGYQQEQEAASSAHDDSENMNIAAVARTSVPPRQVGMAAAEPRGRLLATPQGRRGPPREGGGGKTN